MISAFETHAREVEIDAVADRGEIVLWAISEHIEDAGVHSGDATLVLPPQTLYIATIRRIRRIAAELARALEITGPFNVQFLAKHNAVKVIECNLRASRSFPFVSKVTGVNFAGEAMRRMLACWRVRSRTRASISTMSASRCRCSRSRGWSGADPMLGVEMLSTGEVGCFGDDLHEALLHGAARHRLPLARRGVCCSRLGPSPTSTGSPTRRGSSPRSCSLPIYATQGTAEMLREIGIACTAVEKQPAISSARRPDRSGRVDLVINVPREYDAFGRPDGVLHPPRGGRRWAFPLITDLQLARAVIEALRRRKPGDLQVLAWEDYVSRKPHVLLRAEG